MTIIAKKIKTPKPEKQERKSNPWVAHCKKYAEDNKVSYKQAITMSKDTYVPSSLKPPKLTRQTAISETPLDTPFETSTE